MKASTSMPACWLPCRNALKASRPWMRPPPIQFKPEAASANRRASGLLFVCLLVCLRGCFWLAALAVPLATRLVLQFEIDFRHSAESAFTLQRPGVTAFAAIADFVGIYGHSDGGRAT